MKARDVRDRLSKVDMPPQVMYVLEALAERQEQNNKQLLELATMFDMMTSTLQNMMVIASNMKGALESMRQIDPNDDGPPVTGGGDMKDDPQ